MITQLKLAVPEAVLFGDIGHAAYGTVVSLQSLPAVVESQLLPSNPAEFVAFAHQLLACETARRLQQRQVAGGSRHQQ